MLPVCNMLFVAAFVLVSAFSFTTAEYYVGVGRGDVTGPVAEVGFMGYANIQQKGQGLHLRQFARAFIVADNSSGTVVFVSVDVGMIPHGVRKAVLERLRPSYGNLFSEQNVMISGTHSHSAPGGFMQDLLYDISIFGFVQQTFDALVTGITRSIMRAHSTMTPGRLYLTQGELLEANINRSPTAYLNNPEQERASYNYDVDKNMVQLRFIAVNGKPLGAIHWFAVHPTSMNNTNRLVSSDNVGYASIQLEKFMNPESLPGRASFVGAFCSSNLGDVSPNIRGPKCQKTGLPCDIPTSSCEGKDNECVASGPGKDIFESTSIIAHRLYRKAMDLWTSDAREITGPIKLVHQFIDMPDAIAPVYDRRTGVNRTVRGCKPAMGYSFAAGTTDGPGLFSFKQGTTDGNPMWNFVRDFLSAPSEEDVVCHYPKPILLATGEMNFPFEWQPRVVATQLAVIGDVALVAVPGEFTTMSGRRLRKAVAAELWGGGNAGDVIVVGLSNTYSSYIATPEEYQVQRYEGASTIFGPHTLDLYLEQYRKLARSVVQGRSMDPGPTPPDFRSRLISFVTPVLFDTPLFGYKFGDVLQQPLPSVRPGDIASARFVSGHPRNNLNLESTFLMVERNTGSKWEVVATDADWETKFRWIRKSPVLGTSEVEITWEVPNTAKPGEYRIRHLGAYQYIFGGKYDYEGVSQVFNVENPRDAYYSRFQQIHRKPQY